MANLIEYIQSQIYENSTEDISGSIMQQVLTRMASDEGVVNVHTISGQTPFADYNNAQAARDAVPAGFKKVGLIITYKLSSGWYIDEFIGSATSGWSTASNWKCLGPISVSQNAETGKTTITIGSQSYDVATQPVSVSQNTNTQPHNIVNIGGVSVPFPSLGDLFSIGVSFEFNIVGGINAIDGADSDNTDYRRTEYVKVEQGMKLVYNASAGSTGWATIACYDSNGDYMSSASIKGASSGFFTIPSGVAMIRLSSAASYSNTYARFLIQIDNNNLSDKLYAEVNRGMLNFNIDGGVGYADGTIALNVETGRKTTYFIAVFEGEKIGYDCLAGSTGWAAVAAYDSQFQYLQSKSVQGIAGGTTPNVGVYTVESGVAYVVLCGISTYNNKVSFNPGLTQAQSEQVNAVISQYNGNLAFDIDGGIDATTGGDANHEAYNRTDYISVQEGDIINASVQESNNAWGALALYDSQKNYIANGSIAGTGSTQNISIIIPNGVSFIRLASQINYASWATKNRVLRENDIEQEVSRVNEVSVMKYPNILQQRGCIAIQMDLGYLDNARSGCDSMIEVMREYGLMSMDYAINITALQDAEIDKLLVRQKEGCEIIYHNRINSPSDFSENSTLTVAELKEGVLDERLAMTQKGFTTFGVVANVGSLAARYKPTIDNIYFWSEYGSAQILTSGAENSKAQYLTDHRIIRTGFEIRHSEYTPELEAEMIAKGKAWIDDLCANKTFGVMYCHFYDRPTIDDYHLYEGVLRAMCAYIAEKTSDGELWFGSTTECLNYLCR